MSKTGGGWTPTNLDEAIKRAAGRRRYNYMRHIQAEVRRSELVEFMWDVGVSYGSQAAAARLFGVSEATISRDMAVIMRGRSRCPHCRRYEMSEDYISDTITEWESSMEYINAVD